MDATNSSFERYDAVVAAERSAAGPPQQRGAILFVIGQLEIGGTEQHILRLAPSLNRLGWETTVYSLAGRGPLLDQFLAAGVTVILPPADRARQRMSFPVRIARLALASAHLLYVLSRHRHAIVHFFLPPAYVTGAPLAVLARSRTRLMSRRSLNDYQRDRRLFAMLEPLLHRTMNAILGNSVSVVRQLEAEGIPRERLGLIYNGVDAARFADKGKRSAVRAALGLSPSSLALMVVANLIPSKGHQDLFVALASAKPRLPGDWRLFLIGHDYGSGEALRAQAAASGIDPHVAFLGPRTDVPDLLAAADIGLLCSHEEGFSNALLEGMAAGIPMIATDVGGNAEAVIDGETGIIVPPRAPQRLADAIVRLANDAALRKRLGEAGARRVGAHFSLERCVELYDQLYRALLAGGGPPSVPRLQSFD